MSLLKILELTHSFGDNILLDGVSFDLYDNEKIGLVGKNGTGKSTLLKILNREIIHERGAVEWRPRITVGYLDQYLEIDPGQSIREYLQKAFAGLYALERQYNKLLAESDIKKLEQAAVIQEKLLSQGFYESDTKIDRVATGLGITAFGLEKEVSKLSGGQRAKVILAKLLLENPDVLLMDEPTNFLDKQHIDWLTKYLQGFSGAFIIVSHHFDFLNNITNNICEVEFQSVIKYKGNLEAYLKAKDMRHQQYIKNYTAQKKFIERTEDYINRNKARASTARLAKSREKMLNKVERLSPPKELIRPNFRFICDYLGNGNILNVEKLLIGYEHPLLPELSFCLPWGGRMAITGFNGIGKSTLVKTLLGEINALSGSFNFHDGTEIGYFAQEYVWDDEMSPFDFIAYSFPKMSQKEIRTALAQAGLKGGHIFRQIKSLSGGEQAKARICALSLSPCNLLVMDEPTNHLDSLAKEALIEALSDFRGSVIVISHEKQFCEKVADSPPLNLAKKI